MNDSQMSQSREELEKELLTFPDEITRDMVVEFVLADRKRVIKEIMNLYSSEQWEGLKTLRSLL